MCKRTISVDVISSCVCRDCFEIGLKELKNNNYKIELFYQATSPFSLYSSRCEELQGLNEQDLVFGSPWQRRIFLSDVKKNIFERIGSEKRSSYLILDFTDFAKNLYRLTSGEGVYLIQTDPSKNNFDVFGKYVRDVISPWNLPNDYIHSCLEKYVSDILKIYDAEKIILCKVYHVKSYVSSQGMIEDFVSCVDCQNEFLERCYEYIENEFSKREARIHTVQMPMGVLGCQDHKWGKYTLHFCNEYYEYLLMAVDIICSEYKEKERMLKVNLERCETEFERIAQNAKELRKNYEADSLLKKERARSQAAEDSVRELKLELSEEQRKLQSLKNSCSYKIGRLITFIPRKLFKRNKRSKL